MANPYHHAVSSSKKWGGRPEDYLAVHEWFDASKEHLADFRHRALRHHTQGIYEAMRVFGTTIPVQKPSEHAPNGVHVKLVPTRWIGEQHVMEDLGRIPSLADWLRHIPGEPWMVRNARQLAKEQDEAD